MKTARIVLYIVIGVLVLIYGIAFLLPTEYEVERKTEINADYETVFPMISNLKEHALWSPWRDRDPNILESYDGEDGTAGSVYRWKGNDEVGEGEQEIIAIRPDRVDLEVRFLKPFKATSPAWLTIDTKGPEAGEVAWGFKGKFPRPFNLMLLFMDFEHAIGKDYEEGLQKLKTLAEERFRSKDPFRNVVVQEVFFEPRYFVYKTLEVIDTTGLKEKVVDMSKQLQEIVKKQGLEVYGNLVLEFARRAGGEYEVKVGFPFARYTAIPGYKSGMLPDGEFYFAGLQLGSASFSEMGQIVAIKTGLESVDAFIIDFLEFQQILETGDGLVGVFVRK